MLFSLPNACLSTENSEEPHSKANPGKSARIRTSNSHRDVPFTLSPTLSQDLWFFEESGEKVEDKVSDQMGLPDIALA